jgi:hypothetical protein
MIATAIALASDRVALNLVGKRQLRDALERLSKAPMTPADPVK